jgi:hypothetical protein
MATLITKRGNGIPTTAHLVEGQLGLNLLTGRTYTNSGGVIIECYVDPHFLDFVTDVNLTSTPPADGDKLTWDGALNSWIPQA